MSRYRRANIKGGSYFFTVVTYKRQRFLCDENVRNALRDAVRNTQLLFPFTIEAWVLLPEHLHCIWTLPPNDADFGKRWAMIKRFVTKRCGPSLFREEMMTGSKRRRNESTVWQRRFWEHAIRDDSDFTRHMDYIHYNPVKHGWAARVADWPHSTFHEYAKRGMLPLDWGGEIEAEENEYGEM